MSLSRKNVRGCDMEKIIVGIDPGLKGGIAVLDDIGNVLDVTKMPETPQDILMYINDQYVRAENEGCPIVCYMEQVGQGMPGQSSKATATFARHCGHLDMALLALGLPTNTITPNKWEKMYQLGKHGDYNKTEWKNKLKAKAQQLFPKVKMTLAICDALLLAEFGRKLEIGK